MSHENNSHQPHTPLFFFLVLPYQSFPVYFLAAATVYLHSTTQVRCPRLVLCLGPIVPEWLINPHYRLAQLVYTKQLVHGSL